jgi:hypothetical protein
MATAGLRTISNACPQTYPQVDLAKYLYEKPAQKSLTKAPGGEQKITDQNLTTSLQAPNYKACSQMLPRYSQAVPQ